MIGTGDLKRNETKFLNSRKMCSICINRYTIHGDVERIPREPRKE
jgi:hypothetical protein